jgi:hypothetical protein
VQPRNGRTVRSGTIGCRVRLPCREVLLAHYLRMDCTNRHGIDFACSALKQAGLDGATANGKRAKKIRE